MGWAAIKRLAIASWAVLGVVVLFVEPTVRLGRTALLRLRAGFTSTEWAALLAVTAVLAYVEGHRGFRRSFCPRVIDRAFDLASAPCPWWVVVIAPLYAMSLLGDSRGRLLRGWLLAAAVVAMALVVRMLPATPRAMIDAGVAASLAWGAVELCARHALRAWRCRWRFSSGG
jgi:hypothetical protein